MNYWNVGDKVICDIPVGFNYLTKGETYEVLGVSIDMETGRTVLLMYDNFKDEKVYYGAFRFVKKD
jgi:hypothetical protein